MIGLRMKREGNVQQLYLDNDDNNHSNKDNDSDNDNDSIKIIMRY